MARHKTKDKGDFAVAGKRLLILPNTVLRCVYRYRNIFRLI